MRTWTSRSNATAGSASSSAASAAPACRPASEDYSATEDVFTRAIPFLDVVFVVEILGAINLDWPRVRERARARSAVSR